MNICSYGGGTNSTALLIECVKRDIPVDLILFADTGGEKPHTYKYVEMFSKWLVAQGYPQIITVQAPNKLLEQDCLDRGQLPSLAYGFKSCSQRWKLAPQDKYMNNWKPAKLEWQEGRKITKFVGFDADEAHRIKDYDDKKYNVRYPLVDWDMGRDECIESIKDAGLCVPGKSACYFCPSSKPSEIRQLAQVYPELAERALAMEANAELTSVKGLGRSFSWADLLTNPELFTDDYGTTPELICGCYDG